MAVSRNKQAPDLLARVGAFLDARLARDAPLTVGLSGGCDSVVLLYLAARLRPHAVSVLHVHHGLSQNADDWAEFCREYCSQLGVPLSIHRVSVPRDAGEGLEAAARRCRYAAYHSAPSATVLLGQHRGDQAETLLFNLLRGTGVTGAAAIPVERQASGKCFLRPLLDISRAEIEAFAQANGLAWISDESNDDIQFSRNFLRHRVLPVIEAHFPMAESSLGRAAANFSESVTLLDELAAIDWSQVAVGDDASLALLRGMSHQRIKNLLRFRLRQLGWRTPVATRLEEFVRQLQTAGPDRHPELSLVEGTMRASRGRLAWVAK